MKMWRDKTFRRIFSWPFLVYMTFFFVYVGGWDNAGRVYAQTPPQWDEQQTPIEFSTEGRGILQKANELGNHPVLIFEFVRNQIRYEPYRGVRYGAVGTLERGRGNDADQAMLLAALLRGAWRNLHRSAPKLWFVQGDVRITLSEAEQWLGVKGTDAIAAYLGSAGVEYKLAGNDLQLIGHVWLRADLEFGHYRASRFSEANDGILADLDPSFVVAKSVTELPDPISLSHIQVDEFVAQVRNQVVEEADPGTISKIPEGYLLDVADSGAAQFRRYLADKKLDLETALENRIPIFDDVIALPDALPFRLDGRPEAYNLSSEAGDILATLRQRVQIRWMHGQTEIANATIPISRVYGKPLLAVFTTDAATPEQLAMPTVNAAWTNLHGGILLDGAAPVNGDGVQYTQSAALVPYGDPVRLEFACQSDPSDGKSPLESDPTEKQTVVTSAGSMFALGAVNGLNTASADDYTTRMLALMTAASVPGTMQEHGRSAGQSLGPVLDVAAQGMLSETEDLVRLCSIAAGHRAALTREWALVGIEPKVHDDEFTSPTLSFRTRTRPITFGRVLDATDTRTMPTEVLQNYSELVRESVAAHSARLMLGLCPVSAGRLVRDGNLASRPTRLFTQSPSQAQIAALLPNLPDVKIADLEVGANEFLLAPDAATAATTTTTPTSTMGRGWGVLRRVAHPDGWAWLSNAFTGMGRDYQVVADQSCAPMLKPADLVYGGNPSAYYSIANRSVLGLDSYLGAYKSLGQGFVALAHPLMGMLNLDEASAGEPYELATRYGSAVVSLNAMLERFSRPQVTGFQLELYKEADAIKPTKVLAAGDVFNPQYYQKIVGRAQYNQRVESATLELYNEANEQLADYNPSGVREAVWLMKLNETNAFSGLPASYCGSIDVRVKGRVNEIDSAPVRFNFVIDTQPPDVRLLGWEPGREYRGAVAIRGTATDLHFQDYRVQLEKGEVDETIAFSKQPVAGVGLLATWNSNDNLRDTYRIMLSATDIAGNTALTSGTLKAWNDKIKPVLNIDQPVLGPLHGVINLKVSGSDNVAPADSGVKRLRVWLEHKQGYTEFDPVAVRHNYKIRDVSRDVFNEDRLSSHTFTVERSIDTRKLQALGGYAEGLGLTIHAEAEDLFGNKTEVSRPFVLNNAMFNVSLSRNSLKKGDIYNTWYPIKINIYEGAGHTPKVEIVDRNGEVVKTIAPQIVGPFPVYYINYNNTQIPATYYIEYHWTGDFKQGYDPEPGEYTLRVTPEQVGQVQELPIYLLDARYPDSRLDSPITTILFKNRDNGIVPITGIVNNPGFEQFETTPAPSTPVESIIPATMPYWHLAYKPHGAPPAIESRSVPDQFLSQTAQYENNWTEIAHGFTNIGPDENTTTGLIANWNITGVADGYYDLRLVVSDGVSYRTLVIPNLNVQSNLAPGDDPDDRQPGVVKLRQKDFSVKFEGFPVDIAREYSSARAYEKGDFGYGWSMSDISMRVIKDILDSKDEFNPQFGTHTLYKLQAKIKLPDGREFVYANQPPLFNYAANFNNAFSRLNEFYRRPYGQHLWLPGYNYYAGLISLPDSVTQTPGWKQVAKYKATHGGGSPDGSIGCLQLEDGSFIIFDWSSGRMLRRDMGDSINPDEGRILDFDLQTDGSTLIQDHLGRKISVARNDKGLITSITDPRGFACRYAYNANDELTSMTDRVGNTRLFEYDVKHPHHLAKMTVLRKAGNVTMTYDYTTDGKLDTMKAGDAEIDMEYEDFSTGGGVQTVVDKQTGGQTEVEYNAEGLVKSKTDAAGVKTTYEYGEEDGISGILKAQTEGGVTTSFDYDLSDTHYGTTYRGYDGLARQMLDGWLYTYSDYSLIDDFGQDNETIKPGYLTSNQVQPTEVHSPAVGPDGNELSDTNDVAIDYFSGAPKPDGTGKIYGIDDPEGRQIDMNYAPGAAHNEMASIDSQNAITSNTYVASGDFGGRIASSITSRRNPSGTVETVSTTNYVYSKIGDLSDAEPGTLFDQFNTAVESATGSISKTPADFWPGFSTAYFESSITTTTQAVDGSKSGSASFTDALGNTIATRSSDGKWSVTLYDAEQRSVFSHQASGDWQTTEYDEAGLVTKTTHHPATGADEVTEYKYDSGGRQIEVFKDGKSISRTEYAVSSSGARSVTQIDRSGNRSITETDSAGRTVREAFVGVNGAHHQTVYGYDTDGRRNYVLSPNGLETWTTFDAAGREIETKTRAAGRDFITKKGYDRFGRLVWSQDPQQSSVSPQIYTTYLYVTDKTHTATAWTSADDCTGVTDPRYGQLAIVFHADGNQDPTDNTGFLTDSKSFELYAYDSQGRQTDVVKPASLSETDAAITTTTTTYDEKGRVAAVVMNHRNDATTDSQTNLKFVFHYDSHGNRSKVVYPSGVVKQWNYKYNSNDELTSMTETQVGPAGAPAPWKTTLYDPTTGLSSSLIDAVGNVITSSYDTNQQLVSKHYYRGASPQRVVNYWYDAESGQLKELQTLAAEGTPAEGLYGETRSYDDETGGLAEVGKSVDGKGIGKLSYAYNNTGALASISWLGRSVSYDYDEFGRMKSAHANEGDWEYTYAPCGKKDSVRNTRANELETREYDGLGRLKSIEHRNVNENRIIFGIDYRLGPDGNRVGAFERRQTATDDIVTSWSYSYDPLGRLLRERRSIDSHYNGSSANYALDRDVSYQYDEDSNRLELIDHRDFANSESYSYVANTQRLAKVSYSSTKYTNYSWTDNGELAREDIYDNSTLTSSKFYTWGIGGTLIGVRFEGGDQDGCKVNYEYDTDNELIGRKVTLKNGTVTENERYLVDHQNPTGYSQRLAVLDSLTGSIRHEIFTDELAAETTVNSGSSNTQFPHADALGSIRALTGKSAAGENLGTDAEKHFYDFTAFGSTLRGDRSLTNYAFMSQLYDSLIENQYNRERWYNPNSASWLSVDSVFDFPKNNGHSYSYVGHNPINMIDPSGAMTITEIAVTCLILAINLYSLYTDIVSFYNNVRSGNVVGAIVSAGFIVLDLFCIISGLPKGPGPSMVYATIGSSWIEADAVSFVITKADVLRDFLNMIKAQIWAQMASGGSKGYSHDTQNRAPHSDPPHNTDSRRMANELQNALRGKAQVLWNRALRMGDGIVNALHPDVQFTYRGRIYVIEFRSEKQMMRDLIEKGDKYYSYADNIKYYTVEWNSKNSWKSVYDRIMRDIGR